MRLTIVYPAIGNHPNRLACWLEPLHAAQIAGLTPPDVGLSFYDDRLEDIPFDIPTDAVVLTFDTLRARRAYQIASDFRRRGVPVIFCGEHPMLAPEEAAHYAEAVVQGELETNWEPLIDDLRHNSLQKYYSHPASADLGGVRTDRRIFQNKPYLPVNLLETGRGCRFSCEFCATPVISGRMHRMRPVESVLREIGSSVGDRRHYLLVDDNFAGNMVQAREMTSVLGRLKMHWATQISINAAHDDSFLAQLSANGCNGVHIGFETLDSGNLRCMQKQFNAMRGGYNDALKNLRRHRIAVYGSFVFGYDNDTQAAIDETVDFAIEQRLFLAAFRPLMPLPGTPLYTRLFREGRLIHQNWWLREELRAGQCVFSSAGMAAREIDNGCQAARLRFYNWRNLLKRGLVHINRYDIFVWRRFMQTNMMLFSQQQTQNMCPLGDDGWSGELLEAVQ